MPLPRLRLPASLAFTALGLAVASCSSPPVVDDVVDGGTADAAATCQEACMALSSAPNPACVGQTSADGAVDCVPVAEDGGPNSCAAQRVAASTTGPCCCYPFV